MFYLKKNCEKTLFGTGTNSLEHHALDIITDDFWKKIIRNIFREIFDENNFMRNMS